MRETDTLRFAELMTRLSEIYRETMSSTLIDSYYQALEDYELEFIEPAVQYLVRTSKWFPKPSEVRELASQYRGEARKKALNAAGRERRALSDGALTAEEVTAFLNQLRARPENADVLIEIPRKGVDALHEEVRRLDAMGARDMNDEKREAIAHFTRYLASRGRD